MFFLQRIPLSPVPPATWRVIFGFNDENSHPGMENVKQAYWRRYLDGAIIGTQEGLRVMLDKAYAEAEAELAGTEIT